MLVLSDALAPSEDLAPERPEILWRMRGILSSMACQELIKQLETTGYTPTGTLYPPAYRDNDRLVFDDPLLAESLFQTLRSFLPERIGSSRLYGLNSRFRSCRYSEGQSFCRHRDGAYHASPRLRSRLTFMIYLNHAREFSGGATRFYSDRFTPESLIEVEPHTGDLLVFSHDFWHDGEAVTHGVKYVLRSDILYSDEAPDYACESAQAAPSASTGYIWKILALRDGRLARGGRDGLIRIGAGAQEQQLASHGLSVMALAQARDGRIWSGGRDGSLCIWQAAWSDASCECLPEAHRGAVLSLCALPDGRVVSGGADGRIICWSESGEALAEWAGPGGWVWDLRLDAKARLLAVSESGGVQVYAKTESGFAPGLCFRAPAAQLSLAILPADRFATGGVDGRIRLWSKAGQTGEWTAHQGAVRALAALPGGLLASGGEDDSVKIWEIDSATCLQEVAHSDFVTSLAQGVDRTLLSASYDGCLLTTAF